MRSEDACAAQPARRSPRDRGDCTGLRAARGARAARRSDGGSTPHAVARGQRLESERRHNAVGDMAGSLQNPLASQTAQGATTMFKYVLAWLLGVPAGLLVLVYVFTHL
jgi:hypothetical protein